LALPLGHFLRGNCEPFGKPELNPEKIYWGLEEVLDIREIRAKLRLSKEGFIQEFFEKCEHLLVLDPLLLRVLIFICPDKELAYIFEKIPPYLSTTWLAYKAHQAQSMSKPEAQEWISWLGHIKKLMEDREKGESE